VSKVKSALLRLAKAKLRLSGPASGATAVRVQGRYARVAANLTWVVRPAVKGRAMAALSAVKVRQCVAGPAQAEPLLSGPWECLVSMPMCRV